MEWKNGRYTISDDSSKIDIGYTQQLLSETYWARRRPIDVFKKAIENSILFGIYEGEKQIGFGRVVTDKAVFAWLADFVIDENYKGKGLGKWLTKCITSHPDVTDCQMVLQTKDAHGLYEKFGFEKAEMMRRNFIGFVEDKVG